ncbi:MAG: hypothetical protein IKC19_05025 [Bacteroidales bacterium]|nr:hypothetical protein [Bacteroidales bacterium]
MMKVKNREWSAVKGRFLFAVPVVALLSLMLVSCGRDRCNTPFGEGGTFDINQFGELSNVGGSVVINRGYKGILVRRITYNSFVAFECACPKDHEVRLQSAEGWDNAIMVCPVCGSQFETEYGNPIDGSAALCPLYEYNTSFDGRMLSIY